MNTIVNIKNELKGAKKIFMGANIVEKKLKRGELKKVFMANNCVVTDKINKLCTNLGAECFMLNEDSKELAVICKRRFAVSCIGIE